MAAGRRERMRERIEQNGIHSLKPHEQIEVFLYLFIERKDTNPIAHEIVKTFGTWHNMLENKPEEIAKINGIGLATAKKMLLFKDLVPAYLASRYSDNFIFNNYEDTAELCKSILCDLNQEHLLFLGLDACEKLVKRQFVAIGTPDSVYIEPRQIVEMVSRTKICKVILAHNHPSGVAIPSNADIDMTHNIKKALNAINVHLLDHYIVANDEIVSMRETKTLGYRF